MRRVLLILLLIALVPLRGWAADAMAVQMAAQAHATSAVPAAAAHTNCHETQAEPAAVPTASSTRDPCTTCASCQACFTVALPIPDLQSATQALPHALPQAASAQFTSAIPALGQKPPIS